MNTHHKDGAVALIHTLIASEDTNKSGVLIVALLERGLNLCIYLINKRLGRQNEGDLGVLVLAEYRFDDVKCYKSLSTRSWCTH